MLSLQFSLLTPFSLFSSHSFHAHAVTLNTQTEDWTAKKLEVEVPMPEHLDLESLRSNGPVEGEQLQPQDAPTAAAGSGAGGGGGAGGAAPAAAAAAQEPDATIVAQLVSMGFSENGSKRAGEGGGVCCWGASAVLDAPGCFLLPSAFCTP